MKESILLLFSCAVGFGQMPVQQGWVYTTSALNTENMTLSATTVADTNGASGHTISAVVKITTPDSRVSYGTGGWGFLSQASSSTPLCSGDCYDGTFFVESSGSEEYCPIAATYIAAIVSYADNVIPPYVFVQGAAWSPSAANKKNGSSVFSVSVSKSSTCNASNVSIQAHHLVPTGMVFQFNPATNPVTSNFSGTSAFASWMGTTGANNEVTGDLSSDGAVNAASCSLLGTVKTAVLKVQQPQ